MGPTTLFDKSFLQSLSVDESVWFDNFFISVICPIFYVETLADLKKTNPRRDPEEEVRIIADKFPEMHCAPTPHHWEMVIGNLLGEHVPFTGQIPIPGGRPVKFDGHKGVVHDPSPEAEVFRRWQLREFKAIEHEFASIWRRNLESFNMNGVADEFRQIGISAQSCKSLSDAKSMADAFVNATGQTSEIMKLAFLFCYIPDTFREQVLTRWSLFNCPPLSTYAPYAIYVLAVEVFFLISLAANRISPYKPSNRLDIAYLYYLPFCQVFVSSDKLHRQCAPHFLREDQSFIWGQDLKRDLAVLEKYYSALPESEKEEGLMHFASYPPTEIESTVSQAWDRHLPIWREHAKEPPIKLDPNPEFVKKLTNLTKAPSLQPSAINLAPEEIGLMSIGHNVSQKKGNWWQLPRDFRLGAHAEWDTLNQEVDELYRASEYERAVIVAQEAYKIAEKNVGPDHPDVATSLYKLASLLEIQGKFAEAESLYKRSLSILEKNLGPDHPDVATSSNNLAVFYETQGNYANAETLYKHSLAIREKVLDADHSDVATSLCNLGELYRTQGNYTNAKTFLKRSLAIREKAHFSDHLNVATTLNSLAELYRAQGKCVKAESLYKRSLSILEKALGPDHSHVATVLNNLAILYETQSNYDAAQPFYRRSLAIYRKALGPDHPHVATALNNLAELHKTQGNYVDAEPLYKCSLSILEKALGPDHPHVAISLTNLALLYKAQGNYTDAKTLLKRSISIRAKALGSNHPVCGDKSEQSRKTIWSNIP